MDGILQWLTDPAGLTRYGFCLAWNPGLIAALAIVTVIILRCILPQALARPSAARSRQATDALHETEQFLEQTGTLAGVGGWQLDLATGAYKWSSQTYRIFGLTPANHPTSASAAAFYAPEARPARQAALQRAIAGEGGWDLELPIIRTDGARRWVRSVGSAVEAGGKAVRLIGAIQDVTDAVEQRLALRAAGERMTLATECAHVGVWERNVAADTMLWDAYMFKIYGRDPATDVPSLQLWRSQVHPDDLAAVEQAVADSIVHGSTYAAKFRIRRPDGTIRYLESHARVARDPSGAVANIVGVNWDVTEAALLAAERDRQAIQLAESETKFRMLAEKATDVISWVGPDGTRQYVSPAALRIFGVAPDILQRNNPIHFTHPDDQAAIHALQAALHSGAVTEGQVSFRIQHPERGEVWVEANACSLTQPGGPPAGYVSIIRDVTDRTRAQQELAASNAALERLARHFGQARDLAEQANRAKTRFLAGMSHELRTPLNGILGYAQLMRMDGGLTGTQAERVEAMLTAGSHLLEMIHCVLDVSQIESAATELALVTTDLRKIGTACLDLVRPAAELQKLSLTLTVGADVPGQVMADPTRLRQILLNLMGNAVKFTAAGSVELRLQTAGQGAKLRFEVADTGPGVPAGERHRLFKEFDRLDGAAGAVAEGAGLGLSLAIHLAELMGGAMGHDDNPGGGSVFWLELPLVATAEAEAPSATAASPAATPPPLPKPGALRVLVVDDVAMNRDIAAAFIRSAGYEVACADGGAQAITAAATTDFLVVMMDVRMPEIDGLEATRCIRALAGPRGLVPIVALTAQVFTEQIEACRKAGMDTHLGKPFTLETLLGAIDLGVSAGQARSANGALPAAPPPPPKHLLGANLPILDEAALALTAAALPPGAVAAYLATLATKTEAFQQALNRPHAAALCEAAHAIAGSAAMFGFVRLVFLARQFEHAADADPAERRAIAEPLDLALAASLQEMRHRSQPASQRAVA